MKAPALTNQDVHHSAETRRAAHGVTSFDELPDSGYVRQAQIIPDVIPVSSASWWRGVKSGRYPKPVKFSERVTAWRVGDIRQLLANQAAEVAP